MFTTEALTLDQQTYPNVTPLDGSVMGIGMPVIVTFDVPVTDRAEMQKYMSVTSTPAQAGSWHWVSSQEVHWRPRTYWQPGTHVHVDLDVNGVNAGNGIYGQLDRHISFTIGKSVLIKANVATDQMEVYVDGKMARKIPITGGKPGGFQTRSGIKVISEKYLVKRMNSATVGIDPNGPEGYNIPDVQFAMRVTNSGEFLHAAPWSVYAQGHYNVSHGCVGMSTANAEWLYGARRDRHAGRGHRQHPSARARQRLDRLGRDLVPVHRRLRPLMSLTHLGCVVTGGPSGVGFGRSADPGL